MTKEQLKKLKSDPIKYEKFLIKKRQQYNKNVNDPIWHKKRNEQAVEYYYRKRGRKKKDYNSPYFSMPYNKRKHKYHPFKWLIHCANRERNTSRYGLHRITAFDLWKIAKKQKCLCALTGEKLTRENLSVDHITPLSKGGYNTPSNIQLVTLDANKMKFTMNNDELLRFCLKVVNYLGDGRSR